MQVDEKRITEIFFALILVVLLIVLIFLIIKPGQFTTKTDNSEKPATQVINSYNTNNYYTTPQYSLDSQRQVLVYDSSKNYNTNYLSYRSAGERKQVQGLLGNPIDKYAVHLKNPNPVGGYYTVRFHFENYYGDDRTESVTKYLGPYETKDFYYTDIKSDRFKNYHWDYEVVSLTKAPYEYRGYITDQNIKYIS